MFKLTKFFLLLLTTNNIYATRIVMESNPSDVIDGITRRLTVRCSLQDTAASSNVIGRREVSQTNDNVEEVSSIIVMRSGQDVASISHSHGAHVMDGETNVQVTGSVDGSLGGEGFLQLTFDYPTGNTTGEYSCEASTVNAGHAIIFSTSQEVGITTPTMQDLIAYVRQNEQHKDQLQQQLDQLKNKTNTVIFSVVLTTQLTIPAHQTVVFNNVYVNQGNDYNPATGEFICSVAGYYSFSVGAHINNIDPHVFFIIYHNTENVLANYATSKNGDPEMAFNSVIRKVAKGDVVKVVSYDNSMTFSSDRDRYASFSGHLLAPL